MITFGREYMSSKDHSVLEILGDFRLRSELCQFDAENFRSFRIINSTGLWKIFFNGHLYWELIGESFEIHKKIFKMIRKPSFLKLFSQLSYAIVTNWYFRSRRCNSTSKISPTYLMLTYKLWQYNNDCDCVN